MSDQKKGLAGAGAHGAANIAPAKTASDDPKAANQVPIEAHVSRSPEREAPEPDRQYQVPPRSQYPGHYSNQTAINPEEASRRKLLRPDTIDQSMNILNDTDYPATTEFTTSPAEESMNYINAKSSANSNSRSPSENSASFLNRSLNASSKITVNNSKQRQYPDLSNNGECLLNFLSYHIYPYSNLIP